jgi:hypothetical protein
MPFGANLEVSLFHFQKEQDMPSGYINPRIHINPPRPHRPSLWLRFRTWWNAPDLDAQFAERVDRAQRREPSSRRGKSYRGLTMGLVPPGSSPRPAFNLDVTGSSYRGLTMGLVPPGSSPHPAARPGGDPSSPVGQALMRPSPGDEAEVELPSGERRSLPIHAVRPSSIGEPTATGASQ